MCSYVNKPYLILYGGITYNTFAATISDFKQCQNNDICGRDSKEKPGVASFDD